MICSIEEAKDFVIKAGLELVKTGLVARTWGNISARISDHQFVITPSGRAYDTLTPDDLVIVTIEDGSYEGEIKPSGEKGVHAAVYQMRPQINFVIHTHQPYASALSILGKTIPVKEDSDRLLLSDGIPCAEYGMYATQKLVDAIRLQMQEHERCKAVLMKYHGAVCMGKDYKEAFSAAYALEKVCREEYERICGVPKTEEILPPYEIGDALKDILYRRDKVKSVICVQTPFITAVSCIGKKQRPYLDDLAQIAGTDIRCIQAEANTSELLKALGKRNAVLIERAGALCTGADESEAQAVAMVLEKACMASYLAYQISQRKKTQGGNMSERVAHDTEIYCSGEKIAPLSRFCAWKDRKGYVSQYSKLK